jgi:phospholipid/cholesterol/gamma-HCH transport system ATP-binding protein
VSKAYGSTVVLDDFSMEVGAAEMKIILGGSGSGKSTILKMVLGLVKPDSGRLFVFDSDITEMDEDQLMPIRGRIGMVFQAGALFDSLSVGENVAFRLREQRKLGEEEIRRTALEVLGFVGLESSIDRMPSDLSGGMRRRVAIARALVGNPEIMLYDEPTAGLDPITSRTISELMMRLRDIEKVTSIFVTHDLKVAHSISEEYAARANGGELTFSVKPEGEEERAGVIILKEGRVLLEGSEQQIQQSDNPYIRDFLD